MSWTRHLNRGINHATVCDWYSVRICSLDVDMNNMDEKLLLYCRCLCAAKAFYSCPAIISRRPESQNTSKEPQLNTEEESKIIQARSHSDAGLVWFRPPPVRKSSSLKQFLKATGRICKKEQSVFHLSEPWGGGVMSGVRFGLAHSSNGL